MHLLVLQHHVEEHPGVFRHFLKEDGHTWDAVQLDEGEKLPSLDGYDALWVMGGPMDVWQEDEHPWLVQEKEFIRTAVADKGMPYLGVCLGHQLLVSALGGEVSPSKTPEIGVLDVNLTVTGMSGVFLDGMPEVFPTLQWHSAEVTAVPEGTSVLASTDACIVQALSWHTRAYGVQFHLEVEPNTVTTWGEIPEYASALEGSLGKEGLSILKRDSDAKMAQFAEMAERVYINWMQTTAR